MEQWLQKHFYELQITLGVLFALGFLISWRNLREDRRFGDGFFKRRNDARPPALHTAPIALRRTWTPTQILGLSERPTEKEVQRAFRILIKRYHPDHARSPHQKSEFKAITLELLAAKEAVLLQIKQLKR